MKEPKFTEAFPEAART